MPRIRPIKPDLLKSEKLYDLERGTGLPIRIATAGLILYADREGRFEWRPRKIQTDVLPYDDCSMEDVLTALVGAGTLIRYQIAGHEYGCFANWQEHQRPRGDERASVLPPPPASASDQSWPGHQPIAADDQSPAPGVPPERLSDAAATGSSHLSDEPVTNTSRGRRALVTNPSHGSGSTEDLRREPEDLRRDLEEGVQDVRAREGPVKLRAPMAGRVILNPRDAPEIAWIAPTERQMVMLVDKANQAGTTVQAVADALGIPIAGVNVGRLLDELNALVATRQARASPKTFAEVISDQNDRALAEYHRRRECSSTQ
ncbi:MAG: hypothetical protein RBT81_12555 [Gammaproteobacteria bacterium]|jgi:hypothetical protein|nr:hypothetical protein [Gammaproteobacteria bacterium]